MGLRFGLRFWLFMWVWIRLVDWWRMVEELLCFSIDNFYCCIVYFCYFFLFLLYSGCYLKYWDTDTIWGVITEFMSLATKQFQQFKYTGFSLAPVNTHPMHGKRVANRPNS